MSIESMRTPICIFSYSAEEWDDVSVQYETVNGIKRKSISTGTAALAYMDKASHRAARMAERNAKVQQDLLDVESSWAVGQSYLRAREEFMAMGASEEEAYRAFKISVGINMNAAATRDRMSKPPTTIPEVTAIHVRSSDLLFNVDKTVKTPPAWFRDTPNNWQKILTINSFLGLVTAPGEEQTHRYCSPNGLPDWFDFRSPEAPPEENVLAEIDEDRALAGELIKQFDRTHQAHLYVFNESLEYRRKIAELQEKRHIELSNACFRLPGLLLFLEAEPYIYGLIKNNDFYELPDSEKDESLKNYFLPRYREYADYFIRDNEGIYSKEIISFWMAKTFQEAKIIEDGNSPLDGDYATVLGILLNEPTKEYHKDPILSDTQKRGSARFGLIYYQIRPFLTILSDEERRYFAEWISEYPNEPASLIINGISALTSAKIQSGEFVPDKSERMWKKPISDLEKTTKKLLSENWYMLYKEMIAELNRQKNGGDPIKVNVPDNPEAEKRCEVTSLELEQETKRLNAGSLAGWSIFHTSNPAIVSEKYWTLIEGDTLDEKAASVSAILRQHNRFPVPQGLLLDELEDIVESVDDVEEQIRPARLIGGVRYRRRRSGPVRILYRVDQELNRVVFCLHKKEAQHYQGDRKYF